MATSSLGRLTLDLAVRLSEFTDGMSRAERETQDRTRNMQASVTSFREHLASELGGSQIGGIFDSLNERFGSLEGGIGRVGAGLAGMAIGGVAVGIGALSKMAIETAKADAELAVMANRANTSVQNFQTLAVAAEGLGVSQENLGDMLADVQEKLGEFSATEGGEASDFFNALKDNTKMTDDQIRAFGKTLQGKDGVEAIQLIKNKLDEMGASAQEQRFILESLGNDVGNLGVVFAGGGKILNQYRDALEEAGVIKTKEAIEQSQILAAQTQSLHQRYDGFKSQLAGQMIPVLSTLIQHFMGGGKQGQAFGGVIQGVGVIARTVAGGIIILTTAVGMFGSLLGQLMAQFDNIGETATAVISADGIEAKMQALSQGWDRAKSYGSAFADDIVGSFNRATQSVMSLTEAQTAQLSALDKANLAGIRLQNKANDGLGKSTKQAKDEEKAQKDLAKAREKAAKAGKKSDDDNPTIASVAATASRELGVTEKANPNRIMGYQRSIGYMSSRIDAWCASFVGASLEKAGFKSTRSAAARSYENYGVAFDKNKIIPSGAIATVGRKGGSGRHVFIVEKDLGDGRVSTIEGNYGDKVTRNVRSKSQLLTVRLPVSKNGKVGKAAGAGYNKDLDSIDDNADKYLATEQQKAEKAEQERQRKLEQDAKDRLSLTQYYATQGEKIETEHKTKLADIDRLYVKGSISWKQKLALENKRYEDEKAEYSISKALQYAEGEEKITLEYQKKILQIKKDFASDDTALKAQLAKADETYKKDLDNFKWTTGEKARAQKALVDKLNEDINSSTMQSTNAYLEASMKATMTPEQYAKWGLQRDYNNSYSSLQTEYTNRQSDINATDERGGFKIESESERNALLESARQEHLAKLYVMESEHAEKIKELDIQQRAAREQTVAGMFGTLTSVTATFFGENSKMHRAAAATEQGYAVYRALIAAPDTYSSTLKALSGIPLIGPYIAPPMAAAAAAMQVAQAAKIRGMQPPSIGGIAHGGMDYIPKETTFLLDKGERVLSPRQNKDLTRYLDERQRANTPNVVVNNNSSAQVTAEHTPDGGVNIQMVERMIKRSFGRIADSNSFESRQIQQHTTARYNRK